MSTHAIINFTDGNGTNSVFQHWDGYPETVLPCIEKAKKFAWQLPRFEADEFSAAYIAANKTGKGNIRIINPSDRFWVPYVYTVTVKNGNLDIQIQDCEAEAIKAT